MSWKNPSSKGYPRRMPPGHVYLEPTKIYCQRKGVVSLLIRISPAYVSCGQCQMVFKYEKWMITKNPKVKVRYPARTSTLFRKKTTGQWGRKKNPLRFGFPHKLPPHVLTQYPTGVWGFSGSVDGRLAYVTKDGKVPTEKQLEAAHQVGSTIAGLKTRVWTSMEGAITDAQRLGITVGQVVPLRKNIPGESAGWIFHGVFKANEYMDAKRKAAQLRSKGVETRIDETSSGFILSYKKNPPGKFSHAEIKKAYLLGYLHGKNGSPPDSSLTEYKYSYAGGYRDGAKGAPKRKFESIIGIPPPKNPHYIGLKKSTGVREHFFSKRPPTEKTHGKKYGAIVGPFKSKKESWAKGGYAPNPARKPSGLTHIYGKTDSITMQKTRGPYKGQNFIHKFTSKPEQHGVPRGAILTLPSGKTFRVTTRSVILTGKKDLWRKFPA